MAKKTKGTLFLFAHGAGAACDSDWMLRWRGYLGELGDVVAFNYPYMAAGRKAPDRLPKLLEAHRAALADARARHPKAAKTVLVGKSMGSRVGCHLSLEEPVDGVICLGYPLKGMGKQGKVRDEILREMTAPVLFVQGTRDNLCPLDLLAKVRPKMKAPNTLHVVEEGNHSLAITKRLTKATGKTQEQSDAEAVDAVRAFLAGMA